MGRAPIMFGRSQPNLPTIQPIKKTDTVVCFLCLFDGNRTPSIRRLVRKPRTICGAPLLTLDPSFYAPSSKDAVKNMYPANLQACFDMAVDPTVKTVQAKLANVQQQRQGRVLIHYFGQGSYTPSSDGNLYFFSEDHSRYKPIKIGNLQNTAKRPCTLILDCQSAAVLSPFIQNDNFAFFSCSAGESLPLSIDAPMDLFSNCLLHPFETSIWWHIRRHSEVLKFENKQIDFLRPFFVDLLESIMFDVQKKHSQEIFSDDPFSASLGRGFIVGERILGSFNVHPQSIPPLNPMSSHPYWVFWDTCLDFALTLPQQQCENMIFDLLIDTFKSFPREGMIPLFGYWIQNTNHHYEASSVLFEYIDNTMNGDIVSRTNIPSLIQNIPKPCAEALLIVCKVSLKSEVVSDTQSFIGSKDIEVVRAGFLSLCVTCIKGSPKSSGKIIDECIHRNLKCAPESALLLGLLIERAGKIAPIRPFNDEFEKFLVDERSDIRACGAFVFGCSRDTEYALDHLPSLFKDKDKVVRIQAIQSCAQQIRRIGRFEMWSVFDRMKDEDPDVQVLLEKAQQYRQNHSPSSNDPLFQNVVLDLFQASIREKGLLKRFKNGLFEGIEIPPIKK